jgi:formylglycine-generating enzyme required for sulfatase activity/tRNA A-37 threonylcarbamoyl transferase component Bud32
MPEPHDAAHARDEILAFRERTRSGSGESIDEFLRHRAWLAELIGGSDFQASVLDSVLAELDRRDAAPAESKVDAPVAAPIAAPVAAPLGRFGRFALRAVLGRGGMGTVYAAFDTVLQREVALKRVRPELLDDASARRRFELEARALSAVDHPNLCRLFDVGEHEGMPFLVMHCERGETLATRITRLREETRARSASALDSREQIAEAALLVEKTARALHHAHEAGLIHRDVKPGNILVRHDGEPVLLDFGLVRAEDGDAALTAPGAAPGSRPYMSPEQLRAGAIDRRTDVYSLGVVLYECLALEHPFATASVHELEARIRAGAAAPIGRVNPRVPRDLRVIVETAMQVEPGARYPTAAALADDLAAFRQLAPIRARRASWPRRAQRWCQRHPARAAFSALLLVSLVVVSLLWRQSAQRLASFRVASRTTELARLAAAEPTLYPAWAHEARVAEWLGAARALVASADEVEARRDALRAAAAPYGESDRALDAATHPRAGELRRLARELEARRSELQGMQALDQPSSARARQAAVQQQVDALAAEVAQLAEAVAVRRTYAQADALDQLELDVLTQLAGELDAFAAGALARVSAEAEWIARERELVAGAHAGLWREAIEAIAADPRYGGLRLAPQVGLLPLGPDPRSGLHEFWHARSGARPAPAPSGAGRWSIGGATGMVLVLLPPGELDMGAQGSEPGAPGYWRESEPGAPADRIAPQPWEGPVRRVHVPALLVSRYELTQGQWERLAAGSKPSLYAGDDHPVENVSWSDASAVLARVGLLLPTEVQWEYACRGGTATAWWTGDATASLMGFANFSDRALQRGLKQPWPHRDCDDGFATHAPVGSFPPNPFGLHDVHGNVAEWCADYAEEFAPGHRWLRGGSYLHMPYAARSAARNYAEMSSRHEENGVRPVRALLP